jgi:hypothetical protein
VISPLISLLMMYGIGCFNFPPANDGCASYTCGSVLRCAFLFLSQERYVAASALFVCARADGDPPPRASRHAKHHMRIL